MKTQILLAVGAAILAGAAFAKEGDEAAVKKAIAGSSAAWLACNLDAAAKFNAEGRGGYYPDSKEFQLETPENMQKEKEFCKNGGKNELTYAVKGVMLMGDTAVAHGSGHYKRTEPGGAVSIDGDYTFTDILVRTGDGWKFKHSHIGAVMPMPEAEKPAQ